MTCGHVGTPRELGAALAGGSVRKARTEAGGNGKDGPAEESGCPPRGRWTGHSGKRRRLVSSGCDVASSAVAHSDRNGFSPFWRPEPSIRVLAERLLLEALRENPFRACLPAPGGRWLVAVPGTSRLVDASPESPPPSSHPSPPHVSDLLCLSLTRNQVIGSRAHPKPRMLSS